jgi:hypothetical protein
MKINITHILLFLIIICLLYTLLSNCGCNKDGFSVGGPIINGVDIKPKNQNININLNKPWGGLIRGFQQPGTRIFYNYIDETNIVRCFPEGDCYMQLHFDSDYYVYSVNNDYYLVQLNSISSKQSLLNYGVTIEILNQFFRVSENLTNELKQFDMDTVVNSQTNYYKYFTMDNDTLIEELYSNQSLGTPIFLLSNDVITTDTDYYTFYPNNLYFAYNIPQSDGTDDYHLIIIGSNTNIYDQDIEMDYLNTYFSMTNQLLTKSRLNQILNKFKQPPRPPPCTDSDDCNNHGTASGDRPNCSCDCTDGWSGTNCETPPPTPCDRYDCNNRGNPIRRDQNNNCICECDAERFTGNDCSQTFQTCGDTDHNNSNTIIPFNCGNIGTLKSNPYNIICDRGECTYDMCCNSSPPPPPPPPLPPPPPPPPPDIDSDSSPSAMNILNAIACQGIMDDVNCRNGGTLESSPTCRCECLRGYTGTNCEKTCDEESPRILPILNRLYDKVQRDLLNEQERIDANRYIEYCQY